MGSLHRLVVIAILPLFAACTGEADGNGVPAPTLLAMSTDHVAVGQPIDFIGGDFLNYTAGQHTDIRFQGTFTSDQGHQYTVDYRLTPMWQDGNRVTWPFVGPYANPFTGKTGDQLGQFKGTVEAINVMGTDKNRMESPGSPVDVTLKFTPSLVVRDLSPLTSTCDQPAKHVLGGFNYQISVEAVGFTPRNFSYIIAGEPGQAEPRVYRTIAQGSTDTFGANGELAFAPVPADQPFYLVDFGVSALGTDGVLHEMELTIGVHRPIEYIDSGVAEIAEIEQAQPDSGCLSGGDSSGTTVTYTQTHTDTRTRTLGTTWDQQWLNSVTNMTGGSKTQSNSVNWSATHTDTQGWEFGWMASDSVTAGGEVGLFDIAKVSLQNTITGGIHQNHTWGFSDSRSVGGDHTDSDTESWATSSTSSHSVSNGTSDFWAVSSSDAQSLAYTGLILPGRFGVFYRQTTRTATPGSVVAYNLCGIPQTVATTYFFDYEWSLDLAQGNTCSPLPKTKLPDPQCIIAPCGGN